MARILIVDDDDALLLALDLALGERGHEVTRASDGRAALASCDDKIDVVVSDVSMPHVDGFTLTRKLRKERPDLGIILLTSRDGELDEALGLDLGADDYVSKPFSMRVLLSRVDALVRRREVRASPASGPSPRMVGELALDEGRLRVTYLGKEIETTVTEYRLLEALTERPGMVISRARLLERVRTDDSIVGDRIIDTYVARLRRKFEGAERSFDRIETVIGAGYRWKE